MAERNEAAAHLQAKLDGYQDGVTGVGQKPPAGFADETDFGLYRQAHIEGTGVREAIYRKGKAHAGLEDREKLAKAAADACRVSDPAPDELNRRVSGVVAGMSKLRVRVENLEGAVQPDTTPVLDDLTRRVQNIESVLSPADRARVAELEREVAMLKGTDEAFERRIAGLEREENETDGTLVGLEARVEKLEGAKLHAEGVEQRVETLFQMTNFLTRRLTKLKKRVSKCLRGGAS